MDGGGGDARLYQIPGHLVGPVFGASKDQRIFYAQLVHQQGEQLGLVAPVYKVHRLADGLHRRGHRVHRHPGGVVKQRVDQLSDFFGHGSGEKQGLLFLRQPLENLLYVVNKAHIQHPVGLIQHKDFKIIQMDEALLIQVTQAAGCGHQNVYAFPQFLYLGCLSHTAKNYRAAQGQMTAVVFKALTDLDGQLPGGSEDESTDGVPGYRLAAQPLENRGGKGTGFSGARLGAAQHVPPRQGRGNGLLLDGRGLFIALLLQSSQDLGTQPQIFKCHGVRSFFSFGSGGETPRGGRPAVPCGLGCHCAETSSSTWATLWASSCPGRASTM